jgi:predicted Zn-dependent peptidase
MSSRLFQVVREQEGLAYTIYSFLSFFSDTGLLGISAGVSPKNLKPLMAAICKELTKLKEEPVSPAELQSAKEFLRGSILINSEDCEHRMMRLAKNELNFGHEIPLTEIIEGLERVTAAEVREQARELCRPKNWGAALLGPVSEVNLQLDF